MNRIVHCDDPQFEVYWTKFLGQNHQASVFYTLNWLRYQRFYSADRLVADLSFALIAPDDTVLSICPLYLENYAGVLRFSYRGEFLESLRTPLIALDHQPKSGKAIETEVFGYIDRLARDKGVFKCTFLIDPLCAIYEAEHFNRLTRHGYIDASISTQIIDLRLPREQLWMDLRKSYKPLINKAEGTYEVIIMDHRNADFSLHEGYRQLHLKAAGRVTRPISTFNTQFEMLQADQAVLIGIKFNGRFVSISYFQHFHRSAYYASETDDPDVQVPVTYGPLTQWRAMLYYKERGFNYIELDNQQFGPQLFDDPSDKELSISMFKRGFGGRTLPLFRGVKYYNRELLRKEVNENSERLIQRLCHVESER
jgi:hypothetical protein